MYRGLIRVSLGTVLAFACASCSKDPEKSAPLPAATEAPPAAAQPASPQSADVGAEATSEQYATILNIAGRQRMLTQKMAKECLLVAADIDAAGNRKNAAESLALFKKSANGLRAGDESMRLPPGHFGKVNQQLDALGTASKPFEKLVEKIAGGATPSKEEITALRDQTDALLEKEELIVSVLSGHAGLAMTKGKIDPTLASANVLMDVSGRQRMLSQKMSKDALLVFLKVDADRHRAELKKTGSLFDKVLVGLRNGDKDIGLRAADDPQVRAQLDAVHGLWKPFYEIVKKHAESKTDMTRPEAEQVAKLNLPILKEANKAVELFEKATTGAAVGGAAAAPAAAVARP